ncbi:MAG: IPT/TIG domain-containing protein [Phycisphaeraceae bacterium]|nr:IPT/TIG domain-containing protein [Phycisphaeraceae bacterium]
MFKNLRPGLSSTYSPRLALISAISLIGLLPSTSAIAQLLGINLFPADNPWNQSIATAPVAASSAAIMSNIISRYGDGRFHPDFSQDFQNGSDLYGIPFNVVHGNSTPKIAVVLGIYANQSDPTPCPIPANAVLEGDYQNGPRFGLAARGDSHLLVWDIDTNVLYEFYNASRPNENPDNKWHAANEAVWDLKANTFRTRGWTSADAAGLPILTGLARPDELAAGVIRHPLRFTLQNAVILNKYIYPGSHVANPGNNNAAIQPPMGSRFRLKSSVNISNMYPQSKIVAQAMKDYGLILADNGSNFFVTGASYSVDANNTPTVTWDDDDIQDSVRGLKSLRYADFEMVDLTPIVTGLSASAGAPGSSLTVIGQNFAGSCGNLAVLFGSTPATSVAFIDDAHLLVTVPAGSGSVDVRVRSGIVTPPEPQNIKSPIYGYGISAIVPNARFTFGAACPGDLNGDSFVDDSDFVIFAGAYDVLDCADPSMPVGCPADLNDDNFVDDADFVVFANAYNMLTCL